MTCEFITLTENQIINVTKNTQYVLNLQNPGTYGLTLQFENPNISAEIIGLYKCANTKINLKTIAHHKNINTSCLTKVKGVLYTGGVSDYVGKIYIENNAKQTSSFLNHDVLVVGENTKNNTQPLLQIENDEVQASHGATTGTISVDSIYYLTSRGLDKQQAEELIINGFFESLLNTIIDQEIKNKVASYLQIESSI